MMREAARAKKAVNVSLDARLLAAARDAGLNLSATLEEAVERELRARRRMLWLEANAEAIEAYNLEVAEHGTFGDGLRAF